VDIAKLELLISNFIQEEFLYDKPEIKITNELNIIEQGILDSMDIFRLIEFIEQEVDVSFEPEDMVQTNFQSINDMINFIKIKTK
jgi:acyl carrier protein